MSYLRRRLSDDVGGVLLFIIASPLLLVVGIAALPVLFLDWLGDKIGYNRG